MSDSSKPDGGVKRTRVEASATAAELREFISSMKGKSPQEMLGSVAQSGLVRATTEATIWTLVLMAGFTLVPYFMKSKDAKAGPQPAAATAKKDDKVDASKASAQASKESTDTSASADKPSDVQRAAKAMGLDETKTADPKLNPREKDLDSLLDAVK